MSASLFTDACAAVTPNEGAAAAIEFIKKALYDDVRGLNITFASLTAGTISFSSCNHFGPMSASKLENPVRFPPGRETLLTKPCDTGSDTAVNTIGIVLVSLRGGNKAGVPCTMNTSGADSTSSSAYRARRSGSEPPQR